MRVRGRLGSGRSLLTVMQSECDLLSWFKDCREPGILDRGSRSLFLEKNYVQEKKSSRQTELIRGLEEIPASGSNIMIS